MKPHLFLLPLAFLASSSQAKPPAKAQEIYRPFSLPYPGAGNIGEQSPLEKAILEEDVAKVLELLKSNPRLRNSMGLRHDGLRGHSLGSPLSFAIEHNKPKVARALLDTGSDANQDYLLGVALSKKDESWKPLAELLIEHGAQVNPPASYERGELPIVSLLGVPFQTRQKWDFLLRQGIPPLTQVSPSDSKSELILERAFTKKNSDALAAMLAFLPVDVRITVHHHRYIHRPQTPWDLAVINRNVPALKQLIARGADKEAHNIRGHTALYYAVEEQDEMMKTLLDAGAQPNEEILNYAIDRAVPLRRKAPETARAAVQFLAPLVARVASLPHSSGTYSPLLRTVLTGNPEVLHLLFEAHPPSDDRERFFVAASQGDLETLKKLGSKKPELISLPLPDGETPLHLASLWAQEGAIRFLLSHGAQVNSLAKYGKTPLHYALEHPDIRRTRSTVACLFARGANPNALGIHYQAFGIHRDSNYREPAFSCAIRLADENLVRQFLNAGAYLDGPDGYSDVPLNMVVELMTRHQNPWPYGLDSNPMSRATGLSLVQLLLERGANPNTPEPPIMAAMARDEPDMVLSKLLLRFGADINAKDADNRAALSSLALAVDYHGKDEDKNFAIAKVRFALEHGADPGIIPKYNGSIMTEVCYAFAQADTQEKPNTRSKSDWLTIARSLLERNRGALLASSSYTSPLFIAIGVRSPELVALLLEYGADPNEKNADGQTALDILRKSGRTEMVELMEKAIASQHTGHK